MKKFIFILTWLFTGILLCFPAAASEEPTVYVSSGSGNDQNAGTADAPLKTLYAGFRALPNGGKIVVTDTLVLSEATNEFLKVDGLITITSVGDKDYRPTAGGNASIHMLGHIALKGAVKFENLRIVTMAKHLVFLCNGYYTCFSEGLEISALGSSATLPSIVGGTQGRLPAEGSYVEIHSGSWLRARGGARGNGATQLGDVTFVIYGGSFAETVDLGGDSDCAGNANLYIYGGEFQAAVCLASNQSILGNVRASIYGGNFAQGIRLSRGGTIGGNCDVYLHADAACTLFPGSGAVQGKTTVYAATDTKSYVLSLHTETMNTAAMQAARSADEAALQAALETKFVVSSTIPLHARSMTASGTARKQAAAASLCGDVNADGRITLADALHAIRSIGDSYTATADTDGDGRVTVTDARTLLQAMLRGESTVKREAAEDLLSDTLSLYGSASVRDGKITKGFAFGTADTENYTVCSDVILDAGGIVGLFFGCDKADPREIDGYYFEVNTARGVLAAYQITDGSYRTVGEKKLDLLANSARISVTYIDGTAELYFDDNPLSDSVFFDFDFFFPAKGSAVGIYVENATATLPTCVTASKSDTPTYQNDLIDNFNDPEIFYENGTYYIFGGGSKGVRLYTTTDFQNFTYYGTVVEQGDAFGDREFVAANIVKKDGWYYLFYLSCSNALGASAESCASSRSITGPYTNASKQPLAAGSDIIGGQPFVDEDGTVYLIYTRTTGGNQTYGAKVILKDGTATLDRSTETVLLTVTEEWEYARACVLECGFIVKHGGLYYLLYAGGNYNSTYGVGYAVSENPLGPYTKYDCNPILTSNDQSFGVGAASVFPSADGSEHYIVYLRNYSYAAVRPLQTCMDRIQFVKDPRGGPDILEIAGPSVNPQPVPSGTGEASAIDYQSARFHW
ncbi:MAG: family 43 glycosylhydrolase [Clostridia bacterium]|nr:family 43 glycosylhydrolase [Clostridia bacterium]